MASIVRTSKYRHVYCDQPRLDATWQNLRISTVTGDHNYIKANPLYMAVGLAVSLLFDHKILHLTSPSNLISCREEEDRWQ